jgi:hypothetical protein
MLQLLGLAGAIVAALVLAPAKEAGAPRAGIAILPRVL